MEDYDKKLKLPSRELRKILTKPENLLWSKLMQKQLHNLLFYRQKPLGGYIVDFYCPKAKLVIEVDGGQHFTPQVKEYDDIRDECLKNMEMNILRFNKHEVLNEMEKSL